MNPRQESQATDAGEAFGTAGASRRSGRRSSYLRAVRAHLRWIDVPGAGPGDVYLHGLGCAGSTDFTGIAARPELRGRRAIIVDLLGHGASDRPTDFSYTLRAHAAVVAAVLDQVAVSGATLIGHSMGGSIAILLAAARPDLAGRVVVAEPNLRAGGGLYSSVIAAYTEVDFVDHGFGRLLERLEPGFAARVRMADPVALYRSAVGLVTEVAPSVGQLFAGLPQPRALLLGARSHPYAEEGEIRAAGIPVIEVPDAGHDMMYDNPAGFASALVRAMA